jgi:hypothetical protein
MSLAAIGRAMQEAGFSPQTHRIFSWYTSVDVPALCRALHGCSALISQTPHSDIQVVDGDNAVMQPFNLAASIKHCLTLSRAVWGWVYRSLFPRAQRL